MLLEQHIHSTGSQISIDGESFELVNSSMYLGININSQNISEEIRHRMLLAVDRCVKIFQKTLRPYLIHKENFVY